MTEDQIVQEITERSWRFGVAVLLTPDAFVTVGKLQCAGCFDGDKALLMVARGTEGWLGTLLHEYSHLTQWAENAPVWRADLPGNWADSWLQGKPIANIRQKIANTRELEADCERRTLRLIKELDAPIDVEAYARAANAYVHFYNVIAEKRKWYATDKSPQTMPTVLAAANPTLDVSFEHTPKVLYKELLGCIAEK